MKTVFAQTFGFDWSVLSIWWTTHSPAAGELLGCSEYASGGSIHDTAGRVSFLTSFAKSPGHVGRNAFW